MPLRSLRERVFQTLSYEAGGLLLAAPLYSLILDETGTTSVILLVSLSLAVLIWSPIHNSLFDLADFRLTGRVASDRPHGLRLLHAVSHELTSCLVTTPIIMFMSDFGFWNALAVDVGLTLLYTAYAYIFHILYDWMRPVDYEPVVFR